MHKIRSSSKFTIPRGYRAACKFPSSYSRCRPLILNTLLGTDITITFISSKTTVIFEINILPLFVEWQLEII